jgi:hypothetical protein
MAGPRVKRPRTGGACRRALDPVGPAPPTLAFGLAATAWRADTRPAMTRGGGSSLLRIAAGSERWPPRSGDQPRCKAIPAFQSGRSFSSTAFPWNDSYRECLSAANQLAATFQGQQRLHRIAAPVPGIIEAEHISGAIPAAAQAGCRRLPRATNSGGSTSHQAS